MAGTALIAEALAFAFNLEELPAVGVGAHAGFAWLKEFASQYVVQQWPSAEKDIGVHLCGIRESQRGEDIQDFANHDAGRELRRQEHQIRQIEKSIRAFGFPNPVLVDAGNTIIAGNGRVEAAKLAGMAGVPTIRIDWLAREDLRFRR
jgi:hypothetical protein